ncbi:FtsW/RodA/SpoVE family cell cycle protein [Mediannikoviicoccus vaginalis]|uniref:FtsW/RodA/SpoVE family cell cycle protein n=1 Tax=Mediannikoviicoccus vaginalis TaxID=2899727 RepID=UPI001F01C28B|nr:FtsW/RodA/SpoVE family cell cycle protein [Mediannikoviicoccus vaginalis]
MKNKKTLKRNESSFFKKIFSKDFNFTRSSVKNPLRLLLWFQILAMGLISVSAGENFNTKNTLLFISFIIGVNVANRLVVKVTDGDNYLLLVASMLFSIGVVMIFRLNPYEGTRQLFWYLIGVSMFYVTYFILKSFKGWENLTLLYLAGCFFMFFITIVFGFEKYGAKNWADIKGIVFQPSELTKILFIFFIASFETNENLLTGKKLSKYHFLIEKKKPLTFMVVAYSLIGLFFIQKDLGSAVIFFIVYIIFMYIFDYNRYFLALNMLLAVVGSIMAYLMFSHIRVRFDIWLDPWKSVQDKGYQIVQSLFALASGGFFGTGLRLGRPDLIPVASSDFIFPAIVEEMGVFTGMGIIMLFMILVYRGFKISMEQNNLFFKYVALGISIMFAFQAVFMIGGVLKLIPMTGITIPFVSYGGSSMVTSFICLGILQYCSSDIKDKMVEEWKE